MLKGRTAVVTGGGRGIGRAVALKLAQNGANAAIIYSGSAERAREACAEMEALGVKASAYCCNVSDFELTKKTCEDIVKDFGKIDILVNNAGITKDNLLLRMSEADFDDVIAVNLKGSFNLIKHLTRYLIKSPYGRIINISSVVGLTGNAGQANYASSKSGLIGLTKSAAKELAGKSVTCNVIAPGLIDTEMTAALPQGVLEGFTAAIPMKRPGTAEDVANAALFLASDLASYITGEIIRVDGGMCM